MGELFLPRIIDDRLCGRGADSPDLLFRHEV